MSNWDVIKHEENYFYVIKNRTVVTINTTWIGK